MEPIEACRCGEAPILEEKFGFVKTGESFPTVFVECPACGRRGPSAETDAGAIEGWNQDVRLKFRQYDMSVIVQEQARAREESATREAILLQQRSDLRTKIADLQNMLSDLISNFAKRE